MKYLHEPTETKKLETAFSPAPGEWFWELVHIAIEIGICLLEFDSDPCGSVDKCAMLGF
jgi:hypothetical protein